MRHGHDMRAAPFGLIDIEDFADASPEQLTLRKMGDFLLGGDHQWLGVDSGVGGTSGENRDDRGDVPG